MNSVEYSKLTPEKVMAMSEEEYLELLSWAFANPFEAGIISDEAMSHLDPDGSTTAALFDEYENQGVLYQNGEHYLSDRYFELCEAERAANLPPTSSTDTFHTLSADDFDDSNIFTLIDDVLNGRIDVNNITAESME